MSGSSSASSGMDYAGSLSLKDENLSSRKSVVKKDGKVPRGPSNAFFACCMQCSISVSNSRTLEPSKILVRVDIESDGLN
jgi:hypothetical protein